MSGRAAAPNAGDNRLREPLDAVLDRAPASWQALTDAWRQSTEGRRLAEFVRARQTAGATIYPARVLRALELAPRESVRVVILGQDPYHGPGQAEGLAFSVPQGVVAPPSLRNVLAELRRDLDVDRTRAAHLGDWARQGVLLLNTCLTVEDGQPASHAGQGWEVLTDAVIHALARDERPKVFMLWGAHAQAKALSIEVLGRGRHQVLRANHPSPLAARRAPRPFLRCGHFGQADRFLAECEPASTPIDWFRQGAGNGV